MKSLTRITLIALVLAGIWPTLGQAQFNQYFQPAKEKEKGKDEFDMIGLVRRLKGRIVDHTNNHGQDHRIWSRSLHQWRDLYVYLPPGFDPHERYPIVFYLHPFAFDERTFLRLVPFIDEAIASGKLPPLIVAAPDGSLDGQGCLERPGSFFLNTGAGPYEDFLMQDVWDFVCKHYPIRPERNAHVLAGISMGGFAAFNQGIRHRNAFGIVAGIHPPLNLRWADVDGNPRASSTRAVGAGAPASTARTKSSPASPAASPKSAWAMLSAPSSAKGMKRSSTSPPTIRSNWSSRPACATASYRCSSATAAAMNSTSTPRSIASSTTANSVAWASPSPSNPTAVTMGSRL